MNDFVKGINTVGQLFPAPVPYPDYPSANSAWKGVANSFCQAGDSIRKAVKDFSNCQRGKKHDEY